MRGPKPNVERFIEAIKLRIEGKSYGEIGSIFKVSRQRAQQYTNPPDDIRLEIKKLSNGRCQLCKVRTKFGQIHHKLTTGCTLETFNNIDNLMYLCVKCHRLIHGPLQEVIEAGNLACMTAKRGNMTETRAKSLK